MGRLHRYARTGNETAVADCLAEGDDVNGISIHGFSPLMLAAQHGHAHIVERLLEAKADVRAAHPNGRTALHFAASGGHFDSAALLVAQGADVNAVNRAGRTPALEAAQFNYANVVALFKAKGADMGYRDRDGLTADEWLQKGGVIGQFHEIRADQFPSASTPNSRPLASERLEQSVRKLMASEPSAEQFAAKSGRLIAVWSYNMDQYADPSIEAWISRVTEILMTPALLEQCEETHLQGEALQHARQCRRQRENRQARRSKKTSLITHGGHVDAR